MRQKPSREGGASIMPGLTFWLVVSLLPRHCFCSTVERNKTYKVSSFRMMRAMPALQKWACILAITLVPAVAFTQAGDPWADSVAVFEPGAGAGFGSEPQYFPHNVLGPPDTSATEFVGSADPSEILALGLGGRIVLVFVDNLIVDGPGPDFTVFENAFIRQFGAAAGLPYAEPALVGVSRNGQNFVYFPFDSLTLQELAGVHPTRGHADPTDPDSSGGDAFDLAEIGMDSVRYIELRDVTAIIKNNPQHPYWDATLNGFDLDAVVAVHSAPNPPTGLYRETPPRPERFVLHGVFPNPVSRTNAAGVQVRWWQASVHPVRLALFNVLGQRVRPLQIIQRGPGVQQLRLSLQNLPAGSYFLHIQYENFTTVRKFEIAH